MLLRGFANRKTKSPLHAGHVVRAGSIGKTYVAALAVMAANEGLLDLDAPIDRYLDSEELGNLPPGEYAVLAGPVMCMAGTNVTVRAHTDRFVELPRIEEPKEITDFPWILRQEITR